MNFKRDNSLQKRQELSKGITEKYPDKIPVIIECRGDLKLKKEKFIINKSAEWSYFLLIIRRFVEIKGDESLFTFVNNTMPPGSELIGNIYNRNVDKDGFLYCIVTKESTFGY